MNYSYYTNRRSTDWKSVLGLSAVVLLVVMVIGWLIAEFVCTRNFIGVLVSKDTPIRYSYDEERTVVNTDKDGKVTVTTKGDDETIAHQRWVMGFYVDGSIREVSAGSYSARVPYARAPEMALRRLREGAVEPPLYTHAQFNRTYLVKVRGWLLDGTVVETTDMATIKAE